MSTYICQWAIDNNISIPSCHKDFCSCVKESMKESKRKSRNRNKKIVENFYNELSKMGLPYIKINKAEVYICEYVTYNIFENSFVFNTSPKVYMLGNKKRSYEFIKKIFKLENE